MSSWLCLTSEVIAALASLGVHWLRSRAVILLPVILSFGAKAGGVAWAGLVVTARGILPMSTYGGILITGQGKHISQYQEHVSIKQASAAILAWNPGLPRPDFISLFLQGSEIKSG